MKNFLAHFYFIFILIFWVTTISLSDEIDKEFVKKNLVALYGSEYEGKEFCLAFHPIHDSSSKVNKCSIIMSSKKASQVTIEIPRKNLVFHINTIPNDIVEFDIDPEIVTDYELSDKQPLLNQNIYMGSGIIVTSAKPILCYGMFINGENNDGYLSIPKTGLGKKYEIGYKLDSNDIKNKILWFSVISLLDDTKVIANINKKNPFNRIDKKMVRYANKIVRILNRGDVLLVQNINDSTNLLGASIEANKIIAVTSDGP